MNPPLTKQECMARAASAFGKLVNPVLTKREWMIGMVASGYIANKDRPTHFDTKDDAKYIVKLADLLLDEAKK